MTSQRKDNLKLIQARIESEKARIKKERAERAREEEARQLQAEADFAVKLAAYKKSAFAVLPTFLHEFVVFAEDLNEWNIAHLQGLSLAIPDLARIQVAFEQDKDGDATGVREWIVDHAFLETTSWENRPKAAKWVGKRSYPTLDSALADAQEQQRLFSLYQQQVAQAQEEQERWQREAAEREERERQVEQERAQAAKVKEDAERQVLLDLITGDPVALAIARVFVAVSREREGWSDQLDSAADATDRAWSAAQRRAKEAEEARREAADAENARRDAEYRADEAERKAKRQSC